MRRLTPLLLLLTCALALGTTAIALAAGKANPTVEIRSSPRVEAFNLPATISGSVQGGVPGIQSVRLQAATTRKGHFVTIKQRNAGVTRAYSFTVKPSRNTFYRVVSGGTTSAVVPLFRGYDAVIACNRCRNWHGKPAASGEMIMFFNLRTPDQVNLSGRRVSFYLAKNPSEKREARVGSVVIHQAANSRVIHLQLTIPLPAGLGEFAFGTCFPDRPKLDHMLPPEGVVPVCGTTRARPHD